MAQLPKKKPPLRTIRVPEGLPSPKKSTEIASKKESRVRPVKTVKGEVVKDSLPSSQKNLSSPKALPKGEVVKEGAKRAVGRMAGRAGAVGAAFSAGHAVGTAINKKFNLSGKIAEALSPSRPANPNVDVTGKSTQILMSKKKPTKKSETATPKKSVKKSATRVAFEKEFRKQRNAGAKEFTFRGKKFNTKLAKG